MIFLGPTPLAGIGQMLLKYLDLFGGEYYQIGQDIPSDQDVFMFALPTEHWLSRIPDIKKRSKRVLCMTICETDRVHVAYGQLFELFRNETIVTPSKFCINVFSRQYPQYNFALVHAYVPIPKPLTTRNLTIEFPTKDSYVFYHIGNVIDPRKNFKGIFEAFIRLNKPDAYLLVKATCHSEVKFSHPRIMIINGLQHESLIDEIHDIGDCYVSFSHSEGIGLGAVEAAIRDKPVIIPSFGGAVEYIKTPYTINCGTKAVGVTDFLFQPWMSWGDPDKMDLLMFMTEAYTKRVKVMNHDHTRKIVSADNIKSQFKEHFD